MISQKGFDIIDVVANRPSILGVGKLFAVAQVLDVAAAALQKLHDFISGQPLFAGSFTNSSWQSFGDVLFYTSRDDLFQFFFGWYVCVH